MRSALSRASVQWGEELAVHVEQADFHHWQGLAHEDLQDLKERRYDDFVLGAMSKVCTLRQMGESMAVS